MAGWTETRETGESRQIWGFEVGRENLQAGRNDFDAVTFEVGKNGELTLFDMKGFEMIVFAPGAWSYISPILEDSPILGKD